MDILSPDVSVQTWEILILTPGGRLERFGSCDLCGSLADAAEVCGAVQDWFALGAWVDRSLDRIEPEDRADLFAIREGLKADGIDLTAVVVRVRPVAVAQTSFGPASVVREADEDDPAFVDTALEFESPDVSYTVGDGDGL